MPRSRQSIGKVTQGAVMPTAIGTPGLRQRSRRRQRTRTNVGGQQFAAVARNTQWKGGDVSAKITGALHELGFLRPNTNQQQVYAAINLCLGQNI